MSRPRFLVICLVAAVSSAGCADGPRLHPVSGQVSYKGKALPGAVLVFHPRGDGRGQRVIPVVCADDGSFRLSYHKPGDGLPAGEYVVTVEWRELRRDGDEFARNGRNLLPTKYANPETSGMIVLVKEGMNELPPLALP